MISKTAIEYFMKTGIWYTGVPSLDPNVHISCLKSFLQQPDDYKADYLQTKLNTVFEGYSYMGQTDSLNQYAEDHLYTYVISDFFDPQRHAPEFRELIESQEHLLTQITLLEKRLINGVVPGLKDFYEDHVAHSLSANYYPAGELGSLRLTEHPDGSLLTVFPFGMDSQFKFQTADGTWHTIEKTNEMVCFSGYLLEYLTGIKALNHKVEHHGPQEERYSFAYFAIPKPGCSFEAQGEKITSEQYFEKYLALFE